MRKIGLLMACVAWLFAQNVQAQAVIEITEYTKGAAPIAVVPFGWMSPAQPPEDIAAIIAADLQRSGRFAPLDRKDMLSKPTTGVEVNFKDWKLLNADHIVVGRIRPTTDDNFMVQVQLLDVLREKQLFGYNYPVKRTSLRRLAHQISDLIYEQLTGVPGAFNTRVAYVTATTGTKPDYNLYVADADGYNAQSVLHSVEPIMSPAWSPDGRYLAYVSFENNRSQIFVQEILTGKRRLISRRKGINGAPAWSPDGSRLAMTLSFKGNPDIYTYDMASEQITQLTRNVAIDTEASWSPDGSYIVFTSDRGGKPQLYKVPAYGGTPERVTYEGEYNARGTFSPDGKYLAMVHGRDGRYRIGLLELESRRMRILTDGSLDESPSFAPNGHMLLYATARGNSGVLSSVTIDGESQHRLVSRSGDVREPAWSPVSR